MAVFNSFVEVLHHIRCKLYPTYLPNSGGVFFARTTNEAALSIEEVCYSVKSRRGDQGTLDDMVKNVNVFFDELAYKICDGFSVNTGYFTVYPSVGGTFDTENEKHDHKKHPITFRFRVNAKLRELIKNIVIDNEGIAGTGGFIDKFHDLEEDSVNGVYVPGNQFKIEGHKIKLEGDAASTGLYFVPVDDPSKAVKVSRLGENLPSRITGIAPDTDFERNKLEIRTQYTGHKGKTLKTPRVISSGFSIERVYNKTN